MQTLKVRIEGKVPLIMHSNQTANPLNPYAKAIKSISSKKKKSDADYLEMSRVEWEAGLYFDDDGVVCIPGNVIEACLKKAAAKSKNGKLLELAVRVEEDFCKLEYPNNGFKLKKKPTNTEMVPNSELDKMYEKHLDCRIVKVQRASVMRSRPRFDKWSTVFTLLYDESAMNERVLLESIKIAGNEIGLCDYRPRYGLFNFNVI